MSTNINSPLEEGAGEEKEHFCPLEASLPKFPGSYRCKVKLSECTVIALVDYVTLSDGNMDFDLDDFPDGAEVIAFKHLKQQS
jgi:hypothetical protein